MIPRTLLILLLLIPTLVFAGPIFKDASLTGTTTISNTGGLTIPTGATFTLFGDPITTDAEFRTAIGAGSGSGTVTSITLTQPAAGLTISDSGVALTTSGTRTFALANDLAALEALSGTNTIYYRSASDTWTAVTIGGALSFSAGTLTVATSGVNLATMVTGTLPAGNGGTGITSLGTGVATALGVNVGSAGAFVVNGGALGTPSSGTLTNATGLPISTGLAGAGTGVLTALGINVGSAGAPVLFNGAGGTPSSLTLTNATGLPINTGLTIASQAQGDILYYNGTNWTRLGAGTSGEFLKTLGAGANPDWDTPAGGGDMLSTNNLLDVDDFPLAMKHIGGAQRMSAESGGNPESDYHFYTPDYAGQIGLSWASNIINHVWSGGSQTAADWKKAFAFPTGIASIGSANNSDPNFEDLKVHLNGSPDGWDNSGDHLFHVTNHSGDDESSGSGVNLGVMRAGFGVVSATVVDGGTDYVVGDLLSVGGGTVDLGPVAILRIKTVSGGAVTSVVVHNPGEYVAVPSNPVSVTTGDGSGATFNLTTASKGIRALPDNSLTFIHVPSNRVSTLIPGWGMLVANADATYNKGIAVCSPSIGLDSGNYSLTMWDWVNDLFRIPKWVSGKYQPTDAGWLDSFTVNASSGLATFYGTVVIGGEATAQELRFMEPSGSGSNYSMFKAQAQAATINYTLPAALPTTNEVLAATSVSGSDVTMEWVAGGSGSGTKTIALFNPLGNQPPAANFATMNTRNSVAVLEFDADTDESAVFVGVIPEAANLASGIKVRLYVMMASATSGTIDFGAQFEADGTDLDSDSFDTATEASVSVSGTSGIETVVEITCTNIDSLAAGDGYRLKIYRDANDGGSNDSATGDAQLVRVEVRTAN